MNRLLVLLFVLPLIGQEVLAQSGGRMSRIARLRELLAVHPGNAQILVRLGGQYVLEASETERSEDLNWARRYLLAATASDPGMSEARGWLGVLRCVEAKCQDGPSAKSLALEGLKELDGVIGRDPAHLKVRLMRAEVCLRMPREWGRLQTALDDLTAIELAVRRKPELAKQFSVDVPEIYLNLGVAQHAFGELDAARRSWTLACRTGSGTRFAQQAARLLRKTEASVR